MPDRDEAVACPLCKQPATVLLGGYVRCANEELCTFGKFLAPVKGIEWRFLAERLDHSAALAAARREERERAAAECDRRARRAANSAQLTVGSGAPWIQFQARMHEADDCASAIRTLPPRSEADRGEETR